MKCFTSLGTLRASSARFRLKAGEFPHSEIGGSKVARHLTAAYRSQTTSFIASLSLGIHHMLLFPIRKFKNHHAPPPEGSACILLHKINMQQTLLSIAVFCDTRAILSRGLHTGSSSEKTLKKKAMTGMTTEVYNTRSFLQSSLYGC
jgi:hypothetical protein